MFSTGTVFGTAPMRRKQLPHFVLFLSVFLSATIYRYCNAEELELDKGPLIRDPQLSPPKRKKRQLLRRWRYASPVEAAGTDIHINIDKLDPSTDFNTDVLLTRTQGKAQTKERKWTRSRLRNVNAKSALGQNLNCTFAPPQRQKFRFLWRRKRRQLTRKVYRMAVLSKLAYYDYRKDFIDNKSDSGTARMSTRTGPGNMNIHTSAQTCANSGTCFALADDTGPPQCLLGEEFKGPTPTRIRSGDSNAFMLWGTSTHIARMKRNQVQQLFTGMSLRFRMLCCRARHNFVHMLNILQYIYGSSMKRMRVFISTNAAEMKMGASSHTNATSTATAINKNAPRIVVPIKTKCQRTLLDRHETGRRYRIEWTLQNWHEAHVSQIKWHDTDLIIATSGTSEIVLSFAGTASKADQFTNAQTLEPVEHSGLFGRRRHKPRRRRSETACLVNTYDCIGGKDDSNGEIDMDSSINTTDPSENISGSIHRGFLNAYSRVVRGDILRLCDVSTSGDLNNTSLMEQLELNSCRPSLTKSLHRRYDECILNNIRTDDISYVDDDKDSDLFGDDDKSHDANNTRTWTRTTPGRFKRENSDIHTGTHKRVKKKRKKKKKNVGCQSRDEKLMDILREIVTDALHSGHTVHLTGHSQGAAIATLLALDMVINSVTVPITNLHLWSFGAPEVADSEFYESATRVSPRLRAFLRDRRRYHRFVTRAKNCETDPITTLVSKGLNRRATRRIGGVRGDVIHAVEPAYVPLMTERSGLEGHRMTNYLKGISIESPDHPLSTDFPSSMKCWLGEVDVNVDVDVNSDLNSTLDEDNDKVDHGDENISQVLGPIL